MARSYTACEDTFGLDPAGRWKRAGVAWAAVCLNFSLWGALIWTFGLVG